MTYKHTRQWKKRAHGLYECRELGTLRKEEYRWHWYPAGMRTKSLSFLTAAEGIRILGGEKQT